MMMMSNSAIFNDLEEPLTLISRARHRMSQKWYSETHLQRNTNRNLHTPYAAVSFRITLSDLEWLGQIYNDMKHRTVSLRQLSFLLKLRWCCLPKIIKISPCLTKLQLGKLFDQVRNGIAWYSSTQLVVPGAHALHPIDSDHAKCTTYYWSAIASIAILCHFWVINLFDVELWH